MLFALTRNINVQFRSGVFQSSNLVKELLHEDGVGVDCDPNQHGRQIFLVKILQLNLRVKL